MSMRGHTTISIKYDGWENVPNVYNSFKRGDASRLMRSAFLLILFCHVASRRLIVASRRVI